MRFLGPTQVSGDRQENGSGWVGPRTSFSVQDAAVDAVDMAGAADTADAAAGDVAAEVESAPLL
jgi:hypothetical protein